MSCLSLIDRLWRRVPSVRTTVAICTVFAAASVDRAVAADMPLRGSLGPATYSPWDGWQIGAIAGYGNLEIASNSTNGPVFGGFVGYNSQWDQVVLGFDLAYKYPSVLDASLGTSQFKLVDYATLRGRVGYPIGQFLPYVAVGAAVGRFNYGDVDIATGTFVGKDNAFDAGFVVGAGVDWAVTPGFFFRAEWEYIAFATLNGTSSQTNTGFLGVGVRF